MAQSSMFQCGMPHDAGILETACRVLMAISAREEPADGDVAELHRFAPKHADKKPDVLAFHVVGEVIKRRRGAASKVRIINQERCAPEYPQSYREARGRIGAGPAAVSS